MLSLLCALALTMAGDGHDGVDHHIETPQTATATTVADVRSVDVEARTALLRHGSLDALSMPAMVMEFHLADDVDLELFEPGAALTITAINGADGLEVIAASPATGEPHDEAGRHTDGHH